MTEVTSLDARLLVDFAPIFVNTPLAPRYQLPEAAVDTVPNNFVDTNTVIIVGLGRREVVLVTGAIGYGRDGEPVAFTLGDAPDGRHFRTPTFPVLDGSMRVFLSRNNFERELIENDLNGFVAAPEYGYIILNHPLEPNENLRIEYISPIDENNPRVFFTADELYEVHGSPSIDNTLSLAAQIAFNNGAVRVLAVQAETHDRDPFWSEALAELEKERGYYLVLVPTENILSIMAAALHHVEVVSTVPYQNERVLMTGEVITDTEALTRYDTDFLQQERVQFFAATDPTTIASGETVSINGLYLAAGAAGYLSAQTPVTTLTNKTLSGFTLNPRYNPSRLRSADEDELLRAGVSLITPLVAGGVVKRSITAAGSTASVAVQEPSVGRVRDFLAITARDLLKVYIGRINTGTVVAEIQDTLTAFLSNQQSAGIIAGFDAPRVAVDDVDPRQINVEFTAQALVPLLFIHVSFSVNV